MVIEPGPNQCMSNEGCPSGQICGADGLCINGSCGAESCNDADDDCDGNVDEGFELIPEVCNGADDDCDGTMDEGLMDAPEICNGLDDDCDGTIDEDVRTTNDVCNEVDDDCDGIIDEGSAEVCNNIDDDCNGQIDDGGALCGADLCSNGACVMRSCANDAALACSDGEYCNTAVQTPTCEELPPERCTSDAECPGQVCYEGAGVCLDETPLGVPCESSLTCAEGTYCADLDAVDGTSRTCTKTCCADADCPSGAVCAQGVMGGRLCVPSDVFGGAAGASCSTSPECASNDCQDGTCRSQCTSSEECPDDEHCVYDFTGPGYWRSRCRNPVGSRSDDASCDFGSQCQSGLCGFRGCAAPCQSEDDCDGACRLGVVAGENEVIPLCATERGPGAFGSACSSSEECAGRRCVDDKCTLACCRDEQCPDGAQCQMVPIGEYWTGVCVTP